MSDPIIPDNDQECSHANVTLCKSYTDDGRFTAYQCDDCGWVTNRNPTPAECQRDDLPLVDDAMWEASIDRHLQRLICQDVELYNAIGFFARAIYRGSNGTYGRRNST